MEINVRYFPHLTRENGPMKTIMHLMVGLSRRPLRPKPIDFLLPWLHRRDIKSWPRIKQKIWCKERSEMEINVRYFPHLTRENGPMKTIMHLMVGLSRRPFRPKPIDFLLPWLHRRDIKSRPRMKQKIWCKERSEMEINVR
jgi:hypothetical protein